MDDRLVRLSDAISAILVDKISGQQLEFIRAFGFGIQAETLNQACDRHAQYIRDLPTVDAVEVVHGRWRQNDNGTWSCSECSSWIPDEQHYYARFCLHCGAKMNGADNST